MPIFLVRGVAEALAEMKGPVILIANLLTEGRGMAGFTAADAVARIEEAIQRQGRRRHHEHEMAVAAGARAATRSSTRSRSRPARCPITASWSAVSSGRARSPATIACGSPTRVERAVGAALLVDELSTAESLKTCADTEVRDCRVVRRV